MRRTKSMLLVKYLDMSRTAETFFFLGAHVTFSLPYHTLCCNLHRLKTAEIISLAVYNYSAIKTAEETMKKLSLLLQLFEPMFEEMKRKK